MLDNLHNPSDLRSLSYEELATLASEIRSFIIETVTTTGGHLGSNLGAVELTLAVHRTFESPRDVVLWDTGHQAYVHKLVTGRRDKFVDLRKAGGLSGYPNRAESDHDWIENSHASTALSYAYGLSAAFELRGEAVGHGGNRRVVAVIGDGALTGGMAYEALNNLGHSGRRVVVILNDNGRSYAPTVSHLSQSLTSLRLNPTYVQTRERVRSLLREIPGVGDLAYSGVHSMTSGLRELVTPHTFFEALGVRYAGPIDGHDIAQMEQAFLRAAEWNGPIVVHVLTQKGRGYAPAEEDEVQRLHDVKASSAPLTAARRSRPTSDKHYEPDLAPTYTEEFSRALLKQGEARDDVVALTAAMPGPTGLIAFQERFPERFFDVGIAEQHEMTAACAMAMGGLRPVLAVYSTFFSRAFDQANLDVGLHRQPVVIVLDRAGVTGDDGPSHHGILDMALTLAIAGMTIFAPSCAEEIPVMLDQALNLEGPSVIRFPKTPARHVRGTEVGNGLAARKVRAGDGSVCLIGVGKMLAACEDAAAKLATEGVDVTLFDPRVISPVDPEMIAAAAGHSLVVTVEDGVKFGGAGMFFADAIVKTSLDRSIPVPSIRVLGLPRAFIPQGKPDDILAGFGLDGPGITQLVLDALGAS